MKVVILAGGLGTRLSEETKVIPKPMVEIGGKPILWHIMKIYSHYGFNEFIICLGYKGYMIKEYFANYFLHRSDVTIDVCSNKVTIHNNNCEPWKVTLVDTGTETMTGGRVKRVRQYIGNETFMMTYGDGVGDVNIKELVDFHKKNKKLATVTVVTPVSRWGSVSISNNNEVLSFIEKPAENDSWINGGFFVLEPEVIDYIKDDSIPFEREPMETISKKQQLVAYKHKGFWKPMDTLRERNELDAMCQSNNAPWMVWGKDEQCKIK